jgi:hypothetical protein
MKSGQIVRFKAGSRASELVAIPREAQGKVVCAYRILGNRAIKTERVDVDFKPYGMLWAQPVDAFEPLDEPVAARA